MHDDEYPCAHFQQYREAFPRGAVSAGKILKGHLGART